MRVKENDMVMINMIRAKKREKKKLVLMTT